MASSRGGKRSHGFADVNGARLYYEVAGEGHPLVLIHGGLVHSGLWDEQLDAFAEHFMVVRYDARGYGRSGLPPEPHYHYRDLRDLLRFLGIGSAHLIGLSMGGGVALELALEHPEMASSLVLVGAGIEGYPYSDETARKLEEIEAAYERGDKERAVELSLRAWTDGPRRTPEQTDPSARERVRRMTAHNFALPEIEAEERSLGVSVLSRLAEVRVPTLVVSGEEDVGEILEIGDLLAGGIENAEKAYIPDSAHHLPLEKPAEFNRMVLEFLGAGR
jgi:3-oxoadipate enol-lactonase